MVAFNIMNFWNGHESSRETLLTDQIKKFAVFYILADYLAYKA
jgi:hypothetical protein